jgi:hypothetical protein
MALKKLEIMLVMLARQFYLRPGKAAPAKE